VISRDKLQYTSCAQISDQQHKTTTPTICYISRAMVELRYHNQYIIIYSTSYSLSIWYRRSLDSIHQSGWKCV